MYHAETRPREALHRTMKTSFSRLLCVTGLFALLVGCPADWRFKLKNDTAHTIAVSYGEFVTKDIKPGQTEIIHLSAGGDSRKFDGYIRVYFESGQLASTTNAHELFYRGPRDAEYPYVYVAVTDCACARMGVKSCRQSLRLVGPHAIQELRTSFRHRHTLVERDRRFARVRRRARRSGAIHRALRALVHKVRLWECPCRGNSVSRGAERPIPASACAHFVRTFAKVKQTICATFAVFA